ncbi:MAG: phasin family protein [Pseudomonadota bacterium]|nr:phasin family protein [Pseudomonadota bacterium]
MATKQSNPFYPFGEMDFSQFDLTKMMQDLKVPGVDMKVLLDAQRKNIEALTNANQVVVQGMQAVAKRQSEILAQAMAEVSAAAQEIARAGDAQAMSAKQAELVRQAFEKAIANMRELAEMVTKSNQQAFELINKRVAESLEELKAAMARK